MLKLDSGAGSIYYIGIYYYIIIYSVMLYIIMLLTGANIKKIIHRNKECKMMVRYR